MALDCNVQVQVHFHIIPYSGLIIFRGANFREKLERSLEIIFVVGALQY